jgi:hypothetical protein
MTKRRSSVIGKRGAGKHQVEPNRESRPAGQVKKIVSKSKHGKMLTHEEYHDNDDEIGPDFSGARRVFRGCLLFGGIMAIVCLLLFCSAVKAHGQSRFSFEAKSVYLIINKAPPKAFGLLPVAAWSDTLLIGPATLPLIRLYNVNWSKADNGSMYHMAPGVLIRYEVGPGGRTVYVRAGTAVVECYELITEKL